MDMQGKKVELLAPAGNMEGFLGAVHAGADAVYLGGSMFGARAYADNFTQEELLEAIRYAHLWKRRVYLTVNTLVKESEFSALEGYLTPFYEAGLDGVIVQDIGVASFCRKHYPQLELHASTQMALTDYYGAEYLKQLGVCRIVPARELSLKELQRLKAKTGLELEVFIHGAMCYCYSGQCLFSSILGGRSGNRGRCAQPCRLPYQVSCDGRTSRGDLYPLSLKDQCTIEHLPALIRAGIDSFKIEGRMKKPEYAAGVTAVYRKYIDRYYAGKWKGGTEGVEAEDLAVLSGLYIRSERQDGYYYKQNGREMVALDNPAYQGAEEGLLRRIRQNFLSDPPKRPVRMSASFRTGTHAELTLCTGEAISVSVTGAMVEEAQKQPISPENIRKQLSKLGDSIFEPEALEIEVSPNAFYPLKEINGLRRKAVAGLEQALTAHNGFPAEPRIPAAGIEVLPAAQEESFSHTAGMVFSVRTAKQLEQVLSFQDSVHDFWLAEKKTRIYINGDLLIAEDGCESPDADAITQMCRRKRDSASFVLSLPVIIRDRDTRYLEGLYNLALKDTLFSGFQVKSLDGAGFLLNRRYDGEIYGDASLYIWNRETIQHWKNHLTGFCLPLELNRAEQRKLSGVLPCEKIFYGRSPMMVTANCVAGTMYGCRKNSGGRMAELTDRYRKQFPVEINCAHCTNIIYNSVPLSLHGEILQWKEKADIRLDFTVESGQETRKILHFFQKLDTPPYSEYTTGHEKRGVL